MEEPKYQLLHPGAEDLVLLLAETLFQINCPVCGAKICRASEGSQICIYSRVISRPEQILASNASVRTFAQTAPVPDTGKHAYVRTIPAMP